MKRLLLICGLSLILAGCQKGEEEKNVEPTPYVDPTDPAIINAPVPDLNYRTGGTTHLVSIDAEWEACDAQLKARDVKLIYSLIGSLKEMGENGNSMFSFADEQNSEVVAMDITKVLSFMLKLSQSATFSTSGIHNYAFTYKTVNGKGEPTTATAALFVPKTGINIKEAPMLVVPLFGALERSMSPSFSVKGGINYGVDGLDIDKLGNIFSLFYEMMARCGYVVLCADGLGLGENYDNHIMCTKVAAYTVIDALLACRDIQFDKTDVQWDKKTVDILGMSEGGYTTMETCKVLQEEYSDVFNVFAAGCVDGPYDVSGSMINAIFADDLPSWDIEGFAMDLNVYSVPVIFALSDTYGKAQPFFSYKNAFRNDIKGIKNFPEYFNDFYTDPSRNVEMDNPTLFLKETLGDMYKSNISALSEQYVDILTNPNSFAHKFLVDCNAFNNWMPEMNLMIFQCIEDDLIPVSNGERAIEAFRAAGSTTADITYFNEIIDMGFGMIHFGASFVGFFKAFKWLDKLTYGDRFLNSEIELPDALMNIQIPALH